VERSAQFVRPEATQFSLSLALVSLLMSQILNATSTTMNIIAAMFTPSLFPPSGGSGGFSCAILLVTASSLDQKR
jgi:hypothetical protein